MRSLVLIEVCKDLGQRVDMFIELHNTSLQRFDFLNLSLIFQLIVKIVNTDLVFHVYLDGVHLIVVPIKPRQRYLHGLLNLTETIGISVKPQILLLVFGVDIGN